jgi:copper oxidase (laccase) domain-containing protein
MNKVRGGQPGIGLPGWNEKFYTRSLYLNSTGKRWVASTMDKSNSPMISTAPSSRSGEVAGISWVRAGELEERMPGIKARFGFWLTSMTDAALASEAADMLNREQHGNGGGGGTVEFLTPLLLAQTHSTVIHDLSAGGEGSEVGSRGSHGSYGKDGMALFDGEGKSRLKFDGATGTISHPGLLAVKTADCVPILAVDPEREAYAALHAGWRGVAGGILPNLLHLWRERGSSLGQVSILLGPHIQGCCFEVRDDCLSQFTREDLQGAVLRGPMRENPAPRPPSRRLARWGLSWPTARKPARWGLLEESVHLVLATVLRNQTMRFELRAEQVEALDGGTDCTGSTGCTVCSHDAGGRPNYSSHRRTQRNGGGPPGINLALIGPA